MRSGHQYRPLRKGIDRVGGLEKWSGRLDLNQRPPAPHAGALPGCATPRRTGSLARRTGALQGEAEEECFPTPPQQQGFVPTGAGLSPVGDVGLEHFYDGGERLRAQVLAVAFADGERLGGNFFVSDDQHVWDLVDLGIPDLAVHAFAPVIDLDSQAGGSQLGGCCPCVFDVAVGNRDYRGLRSEPATRGTLLRSAR